MEVESWVVEVGYEVQVLGALQVQTPQQPVFHQPCGAH